MLSSALLGKVSLSPEELAQVEDAFAKLERGLNELRLQHIAEIHVAADVVSVEIDSFEADGLKLRDEYRSALTALLGTKRQAEVDGAIGVHVDSATWQYGLMEQQITIRPDSDSGKLVIAITGFMSTDRLAFADQAQINHDVQVTYYLSRSDIDSSEIGYLAQYLRGQSSLLSP